MAVLRLKDGETFVDLTAISGTDGADAELPIHYTDKQVLTTDWVASTEYAGFGYQADISCPTTSAAMYADLALAHSEAITGNYSPVADTLDGYVRIFAKEVPAADITIPYIRVVNVSDGAPTGVFLSPLAEPASENSLLYGHEAYTEDGTKLTGAGAYWQHTTQLIRTFQQNAALPASVKIYAPNCTVFDRTFYLSSNVADIDITFGNATTFVYVFLQSSVLSITLHGSIAACTALTSAFSSSNLVHILGNPLNVSAVTSFTNVFSGIGVCFYLVSIAFVPSTIKADIQFTNSSLLSTTSLLSIANGLDATTPATLTMHATSKTNMDTIMVDVTDGVATLGSTKTLTAFITSDKGWTIA